MINKAQVNFIRSEDRYNVKDKVILDNAALQAGSRKLKLDASILRQYLINGLLDTLGNRLVKSETVNCSGNYNRTTEYNEHYHGAWIHSYLLNGRSDFDRLLFTGSSNQEYPLRLVLALADPSVDQWQLKYTPVKIIWEYKIGSTRLKSVSGCDFHNLINQVLSISFDLPLLPTPFNSGSRNYRKWIRLAQ